jgi:type II secretory pathway component GspD/PulD (secretin)
MRVNTIITTVAALMLVTAAQAQDIKEIANELQGKTVPAPAASPEAALGITVSQPMPVEPAPAAVVIQTPVAVPQSAEDTIEVNPELAGKGTMKSGLISVNLKEVELSNVIRLFATLSDANIIVPALAGETGAVKVDVNFQDVEWKPALQAILDAHDLELYEKSPSSEVYSVRKKLPAAEAAKNTRTFLFKHADIAQAEAVFKGIVGDRGQVYAYPQGNAVVVKTTQEIMDDVAQIAERIDQPRQQVLIEARILELTDNKKKDRGVNWGDEQGGGLLNRAVSTSPALEFGLGKIGNNVIDTDEPQLTLNAGQLNLLISALDQVADIQNVSSPKVIVANGETADINILTKIPKLQRSITQTESPGGGVLSTVEVEQDEDGVDENTKRKRYVEYEFGIRLSVTPTVYTEENIAVKIVPIISRENAAKTQTVLVGTTETDGEEVDLFDVYYAIDEKRVETTFMLANKQTAVIGGLTETTREDQQTKVPFLSSIPLIRHLFTYTSTADVQKENVIFVTVTLEDGKSFDLEKAVKTSPLTRKQQIREDNNQVVQDRDVELFTKQEEGRIAEDVRIIERKDEVKSRDRARRKPFWGFLRP